MRALALLFLLWPLSALAADGTDAAYGAGSVVAAGVAADLARRKRRHSSVSKGTKADAAKYGWTPERAAYEALVAKRAAVRRKRRAVR